MAFGFEKPLIGATPACKQFRKTKSWNVELGTMACLWPTSGSQPGVAIKSKQASNSAWSAAGASSKTAALRQRSLWLPLQTCTCARQACYAKPVRVQKVATSAKLKRQTKAQMAATCFNETQKSGHKLPWNGKGWDNMACKLKGGPTKFMEQTKS